MLGLVEGNSKGRIIRSSVNRPPEEGLLAQNISGISSLAKYIGSEFYIDVQTYLSRHVETRTGFNERHRSKYNQLSFKEIVVAFIGKGMTYGDIDAFKQRNYMFTLRARSRHVRYWEINAQKFVMHLQSCNRLNGFKNWQKEQD